MDIWTPNTGHMYIVVVFLFAFQINIYNLIFIMRCIMVLMEAMEVAYEFSLWLFLL